MTALRSPSRPDLRATYGVPGVSARQMIDDFCERLAANGIPPAQWPNWARQRFMWATGKDPLKMWKAP